MRPFVLGTRGSDLALAQTRQVEAALRDAHPGQPFEIRVIKTTGDERLDIDLTNPEGLDKGLFTKQLEDALLAGQIDAAVHSLKDLPVDLPTGLILGAIPQRAEPGDVLVSKHSGGMQGLPHGAHVATSSARRQHFLALLRPDLAIHPIRGNVPTRLKKLAEDSNLDALVLARAGLERLAGTPPRTASAEAPSNDAAALGAIIPAGLAVTDEPDLLPAPGQGALGIECREGDVATLAMLAPLHCKETARCVRAERALLKSLGGGCEIPLGALAQIHNGQIVLRSVYFGEPV